MAGAGKPSPKIEMSRVAYLRRQQVGDIVTFDMILVLLIIAGAFALFAMERIAVDMVALLVMAVLALTGLVTPAEAISGFATTATVTVAAVMVLGAGVSKTGIMRVAGSHMTALARGNTSLLLLMLMLGVGIFSSFLNNTAAIAVFLPLTMRLCQEYNISPSKMLMPLAFASIAGGTMTLIGTSTNILVDSIIRQHGLEPFRLLEFTPLGAIFFGVLVAYMALVGVRLIPARRPAGDSSVAYGLSEYLAQISIPEDSGLVGKTVISSNLHQEYGLQVLAIDRMGRRHIHRLRDMSLEPEDILLVEAKLDDLLKVCEEGLATMVPSDVAARAELLSDEAILAEAIISRGSKLIGETLISTRFRDRYGAFAVAIRREGETLYEKLEAVRLRFGDALLILGPRDRISQLQRSQEFLLVSEFDETHQRTSKRLLAVGIIAAVIGLAAFGVWPILVTAVAGAVAMVLSGILTRTEAVESIDMSVIFLLAGVIPLGVAMQNTGAAAWLAEGAVGLVKGMGPSAIVAAVYILTSILTSVMSNNASAILIAPIVIAMAESLGVSPRPFLFAVAYAASASFVTPIGYHVNTMMYGPGGYRFFDYTRVGLPLNLAFIVIATWLIPRFWPF